MRRIHLSSVLAILFTASAIHAQPAPLPAPAPAPAPAAAPSEAAPAPAPATGAAAPVGPEAAPAPAAQPPAAGGTPVVPAAEPAPAAAPAPAPAAAPTPAIAPAPAEQPSTTAPAGGQPELASPLTIKTDNSSIKLGILVQPQYEVTGSPTLARSSKNLFIRRTRILVGGTLFSDFDYFFETDFPDLFKANAETGLKNTPGMNIQDVFVTYKALGDQLKFDMGYMLPPLSHNAVQSAATLYSWDYFTNTFRHGNAFGSSANPVGRDMGIEARGLVFGKGMLEYRVGVFQGLRFPVSTTSNRVSSRNLFRFTGRLQVNLLDPEPGFFYAGSYLGNKSVLSFGASFDTQAHYNYWAADALLDLPVGSAGVVTAQANLAYWNGRSSVALPAQRALMAEAGYLVPCGILSPIVRFEQRWVENETAAAPDEMRVGGGLALWPHGHNVNLKAFFMRVIPKVADLEPELNAYNAFNLQAQLFVY